MHFFEKGRLSVHWTMFLSKNGPWHYLSKFEKDLYEKAIQNLKCSLPVKKPQKFGVWASQNCYF